MSLAELCDWYERETASLRARAERAEATVERVRLLPALFRQAYVGCEPGAALHSCALEVERALAGEERAYDGRTWECSCCKHMDFHSAQSQHGYGRCVERRKRIRRVLDRLVDLGLNERPVYHRWDRRPTARRKASS
jgi:hypothetical protein